jgi:integrase
MTTARRDGRNESLSPASIKKCLSFSRQFFDFARNEWPHRYKAITPSWIEMLQSPRHLRIDSRLPVRQLYALEDVLQIARVSTETLREERAKVAVCILFLSGMRADALASIPIACIHIDDNQIDQLPEMGVRTKGRKAAITYLLDIPELWAVVKAWDARMRTALQPDSLWYSPLSQDGMELCETKIAFEGRHSAVRNDVRLICDRAGVPYLSSHKLRHGHVVYALKQAVDMADLKAVSQNIMHSTISITDGTYGNFIRDDIHSLIAGLGKKRQVGQGLEDKIGQLIELLQQAKQPGS